MDTAIIIAISLAGWVACSLFGVFIAAAKGRNQTEGFALGLLLGPLGALIEAILPVRTSARPAQELGDGPASGVSPFPLLGTPADVEAAEPIRAARLAEADVWLSTLELLGQHDPGARIELECARGVLSRLWAERSATWWMFQFATTGEKLMRQRVRAQRARVK